MGTDHLLLGVLREEGGIAATILEEFNFDVAQVRAEILDGLGLDKNPVDELSKKLDALQEMLGRLQFEISELRFALPKENT